MIERENVAVRRRGLGRGTVADSGRVGARNVLLSGALTSYVKLSSEN